MRMDLFLQYIFSGITIGSVYAIVAIGYNIIYNATGIINFAQGEFVMLGGMIAYNLNLLVPLPIAIVTSILVTVVIGGLISQNKYIVIIIPSLLFFFMLNYFFPIIISLVLSLAFSIGIFLVVKKYLERFIKNLSVLQMVIVTIGLSIFIKEVAKHIWGIDEVRLPYFTGNQSSTLNILGAHISYQSIWVLLISAMVVILLTIFFKFTLTGQAMRACSANRRASKLCGINPNFMVTLSFMISAGIGALAGCAISPLTTTHYDIGTGLAVKGFTVAVFGGLGGSTAAVAAGLIIGILEAFSVSVLPMSFQDVIIIGILLAVLFFRPNGLFGIKEMGRLKDF